ncbi:MAG TPA: peptidyl-alpha-hydroxyglycine alpha-amidating lyase family protein [Vicinamibacterales bacterium]|nr:peptidyl-alpha-hydroxyglycine alpha-amidating lyase family protein [Vicinamibacterales bacterium]
MRVRLMTCATMAGAVLLAAHARAQDVPRNPYNPAATAFYDVETWPMDFSSPGYMRVSNSGIFVESPDRIYLITRGEIKRPDAPPPNFNGTVGTLPEKGRPKADLRDCIVVANAKGEILERWSQFDHLFAVGGRGPHRIKINPYDPERHVWVVDDSGQQVYEFTHDGSKLVMALGEAGVGGTDEKHFGRPTDIAWLPDGTFFVTDGYANSRVVKFDKHGKYLMSWGTRGTGPGQFNTPHGIDIDRNRRIYVADAHNARVQVFDENGKFLDQWPNIWRPDVIMISADQHAWIATGATNMMLKYDLTGKLLQAWGKAGTAPGQFFDIHGFGVDALGNFYAAEAGGGRTQKFTPKPGADPAALVGVQQPLAPLETK